MARILHKKSLDDQQLRVDEAFKLYMQLDERGKTIHTVAEIAEMTGLTVPYLNRQIHTKTKNRWLDLRQDAILAAREAAGARMARRQRKDRQRRAYAINHTVSSIADIIVEVRAYNTLMYQQLMAVRVRKSKIEEERESERFKRKVKKHVARVPQLKLPAENRGEIHRAWVDSLDRLINIFGVTTIKELAAEMITSNAVASLPAPSTPPTPTTPTTPPAPSPAAPPAPQLTAPPPEEVRDEGVIPISDKGFELIMQVMLGEGGKIHGPINYTGPKETSIVEGVEDAVVTCPGRPDQEG